MSRITALEDIAYQAREHAASLINDVELAATREEHIRLTARANEAENLGDMIQQLLVQELADQR
jgi:phosphotransferase system HPr-like phosphotransfer protein